MHVSGKKLAVSGLLAAFSVVLITLAAVIETSSLFFIAAASFCIGIVLREWGVLYGSAFYIATVFLGLLVAPEKMYCITYAGMGAWLVGTEWLWQVIARQKKVEHRTVFLWLGKYVIFNVLYIPALIFMPQLLIKREMGLRLFVILLLAGQVALWIYDRAHMYMQVSIWGKFRRKLMGNF